jgi:adenylate cyclase
MPTVEFIPSGVKIELMPGESILDAAVRAGLSFANACSGGGVCGGCRIQVLEGENNLPEPSALEANVMQTYGYGPQDRAACLVIPTGDVKVTTSYWG